MSLLKHFYGEVPKEVHDVKQVEVEEQEEVLVPEQIISHHERKVKGRVARHYRVNFKNYSALDAQWMEEEELADSP